MSDARAIAPIALLLSLLAHGLFFYYWSFPFSFSRVPAHRPDRLDFTLIPRDRGQQAVEELSPDALS